MNAVENVQTLGSFFRLLEIDAVNVANHRDAVERLRAGDLHGVLIHNVYDIASLAELVDRLERHEPPFLQTWFPEKFRSWFYGRNLNLAHPDLEEYFDEAAQFQDHLASLFPAGRGITDYVTNLLATLDNGRPFLPAPGPLSGQYYMPTTLRAHLEGGYIPTHCDNEQAHRPSYRHLLRLIEPELLSFVLAFSCAEAGGALEIFNHQTDMLFTSDDRRRIEVDVEKFDAVQFRLPPGSLILANTGRYLNRVTPVQGSRKRWTACSFLSLNRQQNATYCWG